MKLTEYQLCFILQDELFQRTVEKQQNRDLFMRLRSNQAYLDELAQNPNSVAHELLTQRDNLVKEVLQLQNEISAKEKEQMEVQRKCAALQKTNRKLLKYAKLKGAGDGKENEGSLKNNTRRETGAEYGLWLKHVLTTLVLESKVNWAKDEELREYMLHWKLCLD